MNITNKACLLGIFFGGLLANPVQGQKLNLDSVRTLTQTTYEYPRQPSNDKNKRVSVLKTSVFDTNRVLISQTRESFVPSDTGNFRSSNYVYAYNPRTFLGEHFTEKFPNPKRATDAYTKQTTRFRLHSNHEDQLWVEQSDEEGKLYIKNVYTYNAQNQRIGAETQDLRQKITHTDLIERNNAGKMLSWVSFDEHNGNRTQVRDMRYIYLNDTLLVSAIGYVHNNYTETTNKYDKQNLLSKSVAQTGYRQENGKTSIENTISTEYKSGKPVEISTTLKGKKVSSSRIDYTPNETLTTTTTKADKQKIVTTNLVKTLYDDKNRLTERTETEQKLPFSSVLYEYHPNGQIGKITEMEYKLSGDVWKTITGFDERGNPTHRIFYVQDQPRQEDVYTYEFFK